MIRSKNIADYFSAELANLKPGVMITFDVYLYFPQNRHIMTWRRSRETLTDGFLDKYRSRGIDRLWIHKNDKLAFDDYMNGVSADKAVMGGAAEEDAGLAGNTVEASNEAHAQADAGGLPLPKAAAQADASGAKEQRNDAPEGSREESQEDAPPEAEAETQVDAEAPLEPYVAEVPPPPAREEPKTFEGAKLVELLNTDQLTEREKAAHIAKAARSILAKTASAATAASQDRATDHARQVAKDVLDHVLDSATNEMQSLAAEIWKLSNLDPDLEHAVNVSTYAVLFGMAFGRIDEALLADIALAGLLHDVGISQVSASITSMPWKSYRPDQAKRYAAHVDASGSLIAAYGGEVPERVRLLITQHHEKFDGSGYPARLQGFQVNDLAQLLSMADLLDSIASGQWDGIKRTIHETFTTLEGLEKARTFPEHFNPEVFSAVIRWMRNSSAAESVKAAAAMVHGNTQHVVKRGDGSKAA